MLSRLWRSDCIFQSQSLILQKIVAYSYKKEMYCQIFELLNGKKHKVVMNSEVESTTLSIPHLFLKLLLLCPSTKYQV